MSVIDKFLDWMADFNGVPERQIWKVPVVYIFIIGWYITMMGIAYASRSHYGLWVILVGVLLSLLSLLSAFNLEAKEFGRYKWLRKKIF